MEELWTAVLRACVCVCVVCACACVLFSRRSNFRPSNDLFIYLFLFALHLTQHFKGFFFFRPNPSLSLHSIPVQARRQCQYLIREGWGEEVGGVVTSGRSGEAGAEVVDIFLPAGPRLFRAALASDVVAFGTCHCNPAAE